MLGGNLRCNMKGAFSFEKHIEPIAEPIVIARVAALQARKDLEAIRDLGMLTVKGGAHALQPGKLHPCRRVGSEGRRHSSVCVYQTLFRWG